MPNQESTLIKLKVGDIAHIGKDENTNRPVPEIDGGSILFGIDAAHGKGKILFDLPDESQRIIMSTDAETAYHATEADTASIADEAQKLSNDAFFDGIVFDGTQLANTVVHYGECNTSANVAAKTVICDNFRLLRGSRITVKYTETNTAANPTLNVNNTGAHAIYHRGSLISSSYLAAGEVHEYVYDGTYWNYVGTVAENVAIWPDPATETLYITTNLRSGDEVRY